MENERKEIEKKNRKIQSYKNLSGCSTFFIIAFLLFILISGLESANNGTFSFGHTKTGMDAFWDTVLFTGFLSFPILILFLFIKVNSDIKVSEIKENIERSEEDKKLHKKRIIISLVIIVICFIIAFFTNK